MGYKYKCGLLKLNATYINLKVTLLYKGQFENDMKNGQGKSYRKDGTLRYEGQLKK